jgi:hypothetical protein
LYNHEVPITQYLRQEFSWKGLGKDVSPQLST